jgi:hypothetical protein
VRKASENHHAKWQDSDALRKTPKKLPRKPNNPKNRNQGKKCEAHNGMPGEDQEKVPSDIKILLSFCAQVDRDDEEDEYQKERKEWEKKEKEISEKFKKEEKDLEASLLKQADEEVKKQVKDNSLSKKEQKELKGQLREKAGAQVAQTKLMNAIEKSKIKAKASSKWTRGDKNQVKTEDDKTQSAACGALACIAQNDETGDICKVISLADQFTYVVDLVGQPPNQVSPGLQHRAVVVMVQVLASEKVVMPVKYLVEKHLGENLDKLCPPAKNIFEQYLQWRDTAELEADGIKVQK